MRLVVLSLLLAVAAVLAGCRTGAASRAVGLTRAPGSAEPPQVSPTSDKTFSALPAATNKTSAASSSPEGKVPSIQQVAAQEPVVEAAAGPVELPLDLAIATALERNPNLISLRAGEPVAHAAYHVAEVYPFNPFVQVQVLPSSREKNGNTLGVNHYVWLMQTLELAHQRRHREAAASAAWNQVRWNIVQAELMTVAQTERLYFTALYQRDLWDLAQRTAALNQELHGVMERRFKANTATAAEVMTTRVTERQGRKQAELAETNYRTALLVLQRQLNLLGNDTVALDARLAEFKWLPVPGLESEAGDRLLTADCRESVASLALGRPDVMAGSAGSDIARANASLAMANRVQNVAVGPIYERDESGTTLFGLRTQMNLPVWDSGLALANQRQAEVGQSLTNLEQLRERAVVEAQTACERYELARRLVRQEYTEFKKNVPDDLRKIKEQFDAGQVEILNVFAAQNSLLQEERTYLDLLNEVAQAAADVTQMTGLPPARIVTVRASSAKSPEQIPAPEPVPSAPKP